MLELMRFIHSRKNHFDAWEVSKDVRRMRRFLPKHKHSFSLSFAECVRPFFDFFPERVNRREPGSCTLIYLIDVFAGDIV